MIMTFDFAIMAQRDSKLMQAINDAMVSSKNELVYTDVHKLAFFPSKQTMIVNALPKNSLFQYKIVPKEIKYSAVIKMVNNNWEDICAGEIMDVE